MNGGHAGRAGKAALSPDGQLLATADYSEVFVWRYADSQLLRTFGAYWLGSMKCIRFTPDGQHVVGAGTWIPGQTRSTILVWRVSDGALVRELGESRDVKSIALSADGRLLAVAVGGGDPSVILYDVATGAAVRTLGAFAANAVAFSREGFVAATGADEFGDPPTVMVWRASDGAQLAKLSGLSFITDAVAFSPDGRYLAAGDWGGNGTTPKVIVWLAPSFLPVQTLSPYAGSGGTVAFTPDSQSIAAVGADGVNVWHLPDGLLTKTVPVFTGEATWNLIFSDADTLFASGAQSLAGVWRVSDGAPVRSLSGHANWVNSIAYSPDGQTIVSGGDATLRFWRASDGAPLRSMFVTAGYNNLGNVVFSADGSVVSVANGSYAPVVWFWRTSDGVLLKTYDGETGWVQPPALAVSPDGAKLTLGRYDSIVEMARHPFASSTPTLTPTPTPSPTPSRCRRRTSSRRRGRRWSTSRGTRRLRPRARTPTSRATASGSRSSNSSAATTSRPRWSGPSSTRPSTANASAAEQKG